MTDVIKELKSRKDITSEAVNMVNVIEGCFGNIPAEILKRTLTESKKAEYSKTDRSFALTLLFYSAKAYEFVRRSFGYSLSHASTLRRWSSAIDGKPGLPKQQSRYSELSRYKIS